MANFSCMGIGCSRSFNDSQALRTHTCNCYAYKHEAKQHILPVSLVLPMLVPDNLEADGDPGDVEMGLGEPSQDVQVEPVLPVSKKITIYNIV